MSPQTPPLPDFSSVFSAPLEVSELTGDGSEKVNPDELQIKLADSLQRILDRRFPFEAEKRRYQSLATGYAFACPFCGDSSHNATKKRGRLYFDGWNFKCWNEGEFRDPISFLTELQEIQNYSSGERAYLRARSEEKRGESGSGGGSQNGGFQQHRAHNADFARSSADLLGIPNMAIPRADLLAHLGLVEVVNNPRIYEYLKGRLQIPADGDLRHFAYDVREDLLYLLNLTQDAEKVIGMQARIMTPRRNGQRFISYNYSDMWSVLLGVDTIPPETSRVVDRFALFYNILRVDFRKTVTVFEGGIDANHLPNSIATWSAATKLRLQSAQYLYDNSQIDPTGLKEAMRMLKEGFRVFLWGKFVRAYPQYVHCKDLNDVMRVQPVLPQDLEPFFSSDPLDSFYL